MTAAADATRVSHFGLWSDDPAERRRRLDEALKVARSWEAEDAARATYLPADRFYVDPGVHRAAEWAARAAARELGLPFTPAIRWFREGTAADRVTDHPDGFRGDPDIAGYVEDGTPEVVWLNVVYCQPGASERVAPSLQATVAHEVEHVRQQLAGLRGRTVARERLADLIAGCLERGDPVP